MEDQEPSTMEQASAPSMVALTLEGGGLSFSRDVPEATALQIMAVAMGAPPTGPIAGAPTPPPFTPAAQKVAATPEGGGHQPILNEAVGEYMARHNARRNVEKIAAIAQFFKETGQDRFTSEQVKEQFPRAGEKVPGNFPRDFRWAIQSKWIAADHQNPKQYYITNTGSGAVAQMFSTDVRKASVIKTSPKRRGSAGSKNGDGDG